MSGTVIAPGCVAEDCERPAWQSGLCSRCYSRKRRADKRASGAYVKNCAVCGVSFSPDRPTRSVCSTSCRSVRANRGRVGQGAKCLQCGNEHFNASYCSKSCQREAARARKRTRRPPLRAAYEDRDWDRVIDLIRAEVAISQSGCWIWPKVDGDGYPFVNLGSWSNGLTNRVHRISLEAKCRAPLGSQAAHHVCATPSCVNPGHLQPVTNAENTAEMMSRRAYIDRIAELESVIADLSPGHPILSRAPVAALT